MEHGVDTHGSDRGSGSEGDREASNAEKGCHAELLGDASAVSQVLIINEYNLGLCRSNPILAPFLKSSIMGGLLRRYCKIVPLKVTHQA